MSIAIWTGALALYVGFRFWYDNWAGPMKPEEQTRALEFLHNRDVPEQQLAVMEKFVTEDDGKEFIMVNLLRFAPSPVQHPDSGKPVKASRLLNEYSQPFLGRLLRKAGHPVIAGRSVAGYLEEWNTPQNPGWHMTGLVRYRCRRDALAAMMDADFDRDHAFKIAALEQTFAFPVQTQVALYLSPRISVGLVLALVAALLT